MRFLTPLQDIQTEITTLAVAGETTFQLGTGTYNLTTDLTIPSDVYLNGETREGVIIDFGGLAKGVKIVGTNIYNTGTVSVTNGTTTVTGAGTTWTSAMEGRTIFLNDYYWTIDTVTDTDELELTENYIGDDLVLAGYSISDAINNVKVVDLTIQNSTSVGIDISNCIQSYLTNLNIYSCTIGAREVRCTPVGIDDCSFYLNGNDIVMTDAWYWTIYNTSFDSSTGDSFVLTRSGNALFYDNGSVGAGGNGITATDCRDIGFLQNTFSDNVVSGIEFVSGNHDNTVISNSFFNNGGDGVILTGTDDYIIITNNSFRNNTGAAVAINNANCDNNLITGNILYTNGDDVDDSGTGTIIRSNIGVADVPGTSGASGYSGTSGTTGTSGTSGFSGTSGTSGFSGTSGA